ncbi:MAG TPA: hypothetical protein VK658_06005 [Chryseolinea sp.]|nr:hypothetical protein [Chryseolinea sp.]
MNPSIYHAAIVLHIVGISLLTGATVFDFLGFRKFWRLIPTDRSGSIIVLESNTVCQRLMGIGMALIIVSGIVMMYYMHRVWGTQIWFRIKFALLLVVIINGLGIRRMLGSKLTKRIQLTTHSITLELSTLKQNMMLVHILQFVLLLLIFILSVFKFN